MAETPNEKVFKSVGPSKPVAIDIIKERDGHYKDDVESIPPADRLQESSMPMAPAPSPFKLGPMAPGGRK
jgi:hypothetical protein